MTAVQPAQHRVSDEKLAALAALADTLVTDYDLAGDWRWAGQDRTPYLATRSRGRQLLLSLTGNATIRYRDADETVAWMRKPHEIPVYEVCPEARKATDPRVYRRDIIGLRSPVADWLASADATTVAALIAEVTEARELASAVTALLEDVTVLVPLDPDGDLRRRLDAWICDPLATAAEERAEYLAHAAAMATAGAVADDESPAPRQVETVDVQGGVL